MKLSRGAVIAIFGIAVALAMGLCLRNGFIYDDLPAIVENARVTDPSRWHTIPRSPYWLGTLWRPFTVSMFALQWFAGHGAPWVFHLVSLLAYLAVGALLFRVALTLGVDRVAAFVATTLFLVHPLHVEVVANGVGQAELWTGLWLLAAVTIYVRARRNGTEGKSLAPLLVVVALGVASKEQGFIVPLLLAGAEWLLLPGGGERVRTRVRLLVPVTALTVLLFFVRGMLLNSPTGEIPAAALRGIDPVGRLVTFFGVIPEWARLIVWPLHLQADYGPPGIPIGGPLMMRHIVGAVLLAAFVALFIATRKRNPALAFGLFWTAVALAPVSNLLTPTGIVLAERVLFIPTIGLAIALAACRGLLPRRAALAAAALVAILLTVRSAIRVTTWRTQERFFTDIVVDAPDAYRAWKVAGEYWEDANNRPRAIAQLTHSMELWPHDFAVAERLGQMYRQDGHCDQAIPIFVTGLVADSSATSLRAKLIECLLVEKRFDDAQRVADTGVALGGEEFRQMQVRVRQVRARPQGFP